MVRSCRSREIVIVCVGGWGVEGYSQYHGQLPSASYWENVGVPWEVPTLPDNCLKWALLRETCGKKPSSSLPGEWIYQLSLKTDDVFTLELRVGEGLGWATWKSTGWLKIFMDWTLPHWPPVPPGHRPRFVQQGVPTNCLLAKILAHRVSGAPGKCQILIE